MVEKWATVVRDAEHMAKVLRAARKQAYISQVEVAEEFGFDASIVHFMEVGEPTIYATRLFKIFDALDIEMKIDVRDPDPQPRKYDWEEE